MSDDNDRLDAPEEIESPADVEAFCEDVAAFCNGLKDEVERLDNLVVRSLENSRETADEMQNVARALDRLEDDLDLVNSTMPDQQKGKLEKVRAIVEYGMTDASGGRGGVKIDTGEAAAASGGSRDTARRLMDEIGANFTWAQTETPGGPKPKVLKLSLREHEADDLLDDVRAYFAGGTEA